MSAAVMSKVQNLICKYGDARAEGNRPATTALARELCDVLREAIPNADFALVPRMPTNGMVYAGALAYIEHKGLKFEKAHACWDAMVKEAEAH